LAAEKISREVDLPIGRNILARIITDFATLDRLRLELAAAHLADHEIEGIHLGCSMLAYVRAFVVHAVSLLRRYEVQAATRINMESLYTVKV
jgi:hypothetical protein